MKKRIFAVFVALVLLVQALPVTVRAEQTNDDCITFSSTAAFSLGVSAKGWDGTMLYSTDKSTWNIWDGSTINAVLATDTYYLFVRGEGNTTVAGIENKKWTLTTTTEGQTIDCAGNIETLRGATGSAESATVMADYCYCRMFDGCTALTTAPSLPATTLAIGCYSAMFEGCTALTTAPSLPASILADLCYYAMFFGCTSLTTAPSLPATTLAASCYQSMFKGCTSLTEAPSLQEEVLADSCYYGMFSGCTSLTTAPSLPATTLANCCYGEMFNRCTALTTAPSLSATTLAPQCCYCMFSGCTSLTKAPSLPATVLVGNCYSNMFSGCTSLTKPADLSHVTNVDPFFDNDFGVYVWQCCDEMYRDCSNLKIYTEPTGDCKTKWVATNAIDADTLSGNAWSIWMFANTIGDVSTDFHGTVHSGVTYYILSDKKAKTTGNMGTTLDNVPVTGDLGTTLDVALSIASMLGIGIVIKNKRKESAL